MVEKEGTGGAAGMTYVVLQKVAGCLARIETSVILLWADESGLCGTILPWLMHHHFSAYLD